MTSFITKLSNKFKPTKKPDQPVIKQADFVARSTYAMTPSKPQDNKPPPGINQTTVKRPPLHKESIQPVNNRNSALIQRTKAAANSLFTTASKPTRNNSNVGLTPQTKSNSIHVTPARPSSLNAMTAAKPAAMERGASPMIQVKRAPSVESVPFDMAGSFLCPQLNDNSMVEELDQKVDTYGYQQKVIDLEKSLALNKQVVQSLIESQNSSNLNPQQPLVDIINRLQDENERLQAQPTRKECDKCESLQLKLGEKEASLDRKNAIFNELAQISCFLVKQQQQEAENFVADEQASNRIYELVKRYMDSNINQQGAILDSSLNTSLPQEMTSPVLLPSIMSSFDQLELEGSLRLAQLEIQRLRKKLIFDDEIPMKDRQEIPDLNQSSRYYGRVQFKPKPFKLDSPIQAPESPNNNKSKAINHFADISGGSLELSAESGKNNNKVTPNSRKSAQPRQTVSNINSTAVKSKEVVVEIAVNNHVQRACSQKRGLSVPKLDLSVIKPVREFRDWYSYAIKLEESVKFLRIRVKQLEDNLNAVQVQLDQELNKDTSTPQSQQLLNQAIIKAKTKIDKVKQKYKTRWLQSESVLRECDFCRNKIVQTEKYSHSPESSGIGGKTMATRGPKSGQNSSLMSSFDNSVDPSEINVSSMSNFKSQDNRKVVQISEQNLSLPCEQSPGSLLGKQTKNEVYCIPANEMKRRPVFEMTNPKRQIMPNSSVILFEDSDQLDEQI